MDENAENGVERAAASDNVQAGAYRFVLDTVLDGMRANVYVTDPVTDEILYMNRTMREDYGLDRPEGALCWQLLQRNLDRRCPFCPVDKLKACGEPGRVIEWEETSSKTGRVYRNSDSLIRWVDGSLAHLQQSVDITDVKTAGIDELTELLSRRIGKGRLQARLNGAGDEGDVFCVCLFDINRLKEINDTFGHAEGDVVLRAAADAVRGQLSGDEFAFRLSGDEFVCVVEGDAAEARGKMERADDQLSHRVKSDLRETGFCFGIVEVHPSDRVEINDVLTLADERMYEQKRRLHIGRSVARAEEALARHAALAEEDVRAFEFDKDLLYDALVGSTDDYLYVCNMKTGVFCYPQPMVEEFGLPSQVVADAAAVWGSHVHPDDYQAFMESNQDIVDGRAMRHCVEYRARNRVGEWVWLRCRGTVVPDANGEPCLFAGFIANLEKKNEVDPLTGLFNKFEFEDAVRRALETHADERLGLMVLGIDDLRHINDRYDRGFGDDVIRIIAHRIQSALVGRAHVYRLDGDEFAVVARGDDAAALPDVYQALHQAFRRQQTHEGKKFYCTLSAGCAQYPDDAETYEDLVKFANYALEYAKSHGKKRRVPFSPSILAERSRTLELVERLRDSIEHDFEGFRLVFQPQVHAADGSVIGAEALARWSCDACGEVPPLEFIPLLEESGLIVPFGAWVLYRAMETAAQWRAYDPDFVMSVNLSYRQLDEVKLVPSIAEALSLTGLPPANLVVEMTESCFASSEEAAQRLFAGVRALGVRVAMDDFGTGYAALGMLKQSPADIVKIDRTFVRDIQDSTFDATFIRFVVELCHDVGIRVCLEGVEVPEEYEAVSGMGLDSIQGFLFGRPCPPEEFEQRFLAKTL
ncbi:bifunctional diguanylate cyclase/phosphodiesterase [Gordonibacter massiliensis (ex Traore et al. 2017)]|uniref:EAL domain-containing protein n=1 Tax=Gordonibacter massiliensis (ex Traore et al. 2017) TaxID=1841863 RepID=A0A842JEX6_9ACTN|nr:EAL domain-containing protein [Gordonibacter massiliensis (ex Traore et al. 2017)]MBC2888498.1 EAL domain-containing protein [Gordonibacter massiliensis (ex Traore et al. 2017)]